MTRAVDVSGRGVRVEGRGVGVGTAIPDRVATRDPDDRQSSNTVGKFGVQIQVTNNWSQIGAEISGNVIGATRAYIYRVSNGTLLGESDISSLSAGDQFTISLSSVLTSGELYNFVLDAEGNGYERGQDIDRNYPYTSSDGKLSIVETASGATGTETSFGPSNLLKIGKVGFN